MSVTTAGDQKQQKRITKNCKASTHRQIDHTQWYKQLFHLWVKMINQKNYRQTGISRIKAMGSNVEAFNTQSPLMVEPGKNSKLDRMVNK